MAKKNAKVETTVATESTSTQTAPVAETKVVATPTPIVGWMPPKAALKHLGIKVEVGMVLDPEKLGLPAHPIHGKLPVLTVTEVDEKGLVAGLIRCASLGEEACTEDEGHGPGIVEVHAGDWFQVRRCSRHQKRMQRRKARKTLSPEVKAEREAARKAAKAERDAKKEAEKAAKAAVRLEKEQAAKAAKAEKLKAEAEAAAKQAEEKKAAAAKITAEAKTA